MKKSINLVRVFNIVCAVLLVAIAVCQLVPFWQSGETTASIQDYVWFPKENKGLNDYFKQVTGDRTFRVNDMMLMPVIVIACSILGLFSCTVKSGKVSSAIIPLICGVVGIWGYRSSPLFQTADSWIIHLVICILLTVLSALTFVVYFAKKNKKKLA